MLKMKRFFGGIALAVILFGPGSVSARWLVPQEQSPDASQITALRAELEAARNSQARQRELIEALTAQAEAAEQAARLSELRVSELLKIAEDKVAEAKGQQAENPEGNEVAVELTNSDPTKLKTRVDLATAMSQHAVLLDLLNAAHADASQAQDYHQSLKDVQANAALYDFVVGRVAKAGAQSHDYWIGVQCEPAIDVQVRIEPDSDRFMTLKGGLKVIAVTDASPAQTAGVETDDVILYMNDHPTNQIEELVAVIDENGDQAATLSIIREHTPLKLSITPLKRPAAETTELYREGQPFNVTINRAIDAFGKVYLSGATEPPPLAEGFDAQIQFSFGKKPEFKIKNPDQEWSVTGENIEQLPDNVKPFARFYWNVIGPSQFEFKVGESTQPRWVYRYNALGTDAAYAPYPQYQWRRGLSGAEEESTINSKLDQLQAQVNELRALIENSKK